MVRNNPAATINSSAMNARRATLEGKVTVNAGSLVEADMATIFARHGTGGTKRSTNFSGPLTAELTGEPLVHRGPGGLGRPVDERRRNRRNHPCQETAAIRVQHPVGRSSRRSDKGRCHCQSAGEGRSASDRCRVAARRFPTRVPGFDCPAECALDGAFTFTSGEHLEDGLVAAGPHVRTGLLRRRVVLRSPLHRPEI